MHIFNLTVEIQEFFEVGCKMFWIGSLQDIKKTYIDLAALRFPTTNFISKFEKLRSYLEFYSFKLKTQLNPKQPSLKLAQPNNFLNGKFNEASKKITTVLFFILKYVNGFVDKLIKNIFIDVILLL